MHGIQSRSKSMLMTQDVCPPGVTSEENKGDQEDSMDFKKAGHQIGVLPTGKGQVGTTGIQTGNRPNWILV